MHHGPFRKVLVLSLLLLFIPIAIHADEVLDQSSVGTGMAGAINACCPYIAQTFTAGVTGQLTKIDVFAFSFSNPVYPMQVSIYSTSGGAPDSLLTSETMFPMNGDTDTNTPSTIVFGSPVTVTSGTQYAIVLNCPTVADGTECGFFWGGYDPYAGGSLYVHWSGGPPGTFTQYDGTQWDMEFNTYVQTVEPAALMMLSSGLCALAGAFRKKPH